jgi:hypothetical protein
MSSKTRLIAITLFLALTFSACNLPADSSEPDGVGAVLTAAAQTVEANLTQSAQQPEPQDPPPVQVTPTTVPTATEAIPTPTTKIPVSPTSDCDKADFITDVSIPDGTNLSPNENFTKTWRLKNIGTCSWTPSYSIVPGGGDVMGGPTSQALTGNVNPGDTVDISINLKAPASDGNYRGYWKLRNASGVLFATVYVDIQVGTGGGSGGPFAVTSVKYTLSTWSDGSHTNCPRVVASITTNGAGTVTFKWKRKDTPGGGALQSLTFASAGTKTVNYDWARGSVWNGTDTWVGIYVDDPNHQDFWNIKFDTACTVP